MYASESTKGAEENQARIEGMYEQNITLKGLWGNLNPGDGLASRYGGQNTKNPKYYRKEAIDQ